MSCGSRAKCCLLFQQNFAILGRMSIPLDVEVRAALERKRGVWKQVAADTGVSYSWISQFVRGKIPNPGYATLVRLRDELSKPAQEAAA